MQDVLVKKEEVGPFVKWAGGKTQIMERLLSNKPSFFNRYVEGFVGGGALLFKLNHPHPLINDSNEELINCFKVIRDYPGEIINSLGKHKNEKEYFYGIRSKDPSELSNVERASRFIYLNRTCYNGLWRVNKNNQFNTPFGKYKNPKILNEGLLWSVSRFLKKVGIHCMDFERFLTRYAQKGDFVYLDPPYHPISKYSDFRRYTHSFFGEEDQRRLAKTFKKLDGKGCKLLLSNSHSRLIKELYSEFTILTIRARRNINKNPEGRTPIKEVLVKNYE